MIPKPKFHICHKNFCSIFHPFCSLEQVPNHPLPPVCRAIHVSRGEWSICLMGFILFFPTCGQTLSGQQMFPLENVWGGRCPGVGSSWSLLLLLFRISACRSRPFWRREANGIIIGCVCLTDIPKIALVIPPRVLEYVDLFHFWRVINVKEICRSKGFRKVWYTLSNTTRH